ncbi:unnamed protein product [Bursaphelenchus xylophilus]|uniref:(pine wood nematode) hypothetical protein n=1 Tax=Bursaphelenchus xylophilus TaxID=6326 RepID=A0A7I8X4P8_BURXY|nr:unnamed protein product [Bursaphelenchus xylophilus]CAG9122091.1 unnamed protein product [Bursaphelenchus xylophilus]
MTERPSTTAESTVDREPLPSICVTQEPISQVSKSVNMQPLRLSVSDAWKSHVSSIPPLPSYGEDSIRVEERFTATTKANSPFFCNETMSQTIPGFSGMASKDDSRISANSALPQLSEKPTQSHFLIHTTLARPAKLANVDVLPFPSTTSTAQKSHSKVTFADPIAQPTSSQSSQKSEPPPASSDQPTGTTENEAFDEMESLIKKLMEAQERGNLSAPLQDVLQGIIDGLTEHSAAEVSRDQPPLMIAEDTSSRGGNGESSGRKKPRLQSQKPPVLLPKSPERTCPNQVAPSNTPATATTSCSNPANTPNSLLQNPLVMAYMQNMTNVSIVHHYPVPVTNATLMDKDQHISQSSFNNLTSFDAQREIQQRLQCLPQLGPNLIAEPQVSQHLALPLQTGLRMPQKRPWLEDSCIPEEVSEESWLRTLESTIINLSADPNANQELLYEVKVSYLQGLKLREERMERKRQLDAARLRALHELQFMQFQQQQADGYKKAKKNAAKKGGITGSTVYGSLNNCVFLQ